MKHVYSICLFSTVLWGLLHYVDTPERSHKPEEDPSPARTPAEELATFRLEPGLKIQLVAAEPMVQDPVALTFDADGRLWVVEMRGFMPTIDGEGEREPVGRISVLEDKNYDGQMDYSTVFLDSLVLPRAIALIPGGALVAHQEALWLAQDRNGDLRADSKTLIDPDYAGSTLPEHAGNGLWRGIDNWYYNVKSRFRYRLVDGKWQRDSTEFRGQWGISHDDAGRLYYNYNWSQLHADLVPPNYLSRNKNHKPTTGIDQGLTLDRRIYPIRPTPAVNRGYIPGTLDKEGQLLEFTAACSPLFYRGTALPKEYYGNVLVCEPSGNLIKRNVIESNGVQLTARDPHPGREFLASTDERFRPVHMATGPDGALYVADMYRGLIQHGAYVTPYLREQTLTRKLDAPVHRGRIWRIAPENWQVSKPDQLSAASTKALAAHLSHPNGWHRDMAQRLLVERNDKNSGPALAHLVSEGDRELGRFHALWALEGLNLTTPDLLFPLLDDPSPSIRTTALRLLEPLAQRDQTVRKKLAGKLLATWEQAPAALALQITLVAPVLDQPASHQLLAGITQRYDSSALFRDAILSSLQNQEFAFLQRMWHSPTWQTHRPAREILLDMLTTAILRKRNPAELKSLLALIDGNKEALGWKEKTVITAMSIGASSRNMRPVKLAEEPEIFSRPNPKINPAHLQALSSLFEWPGHVASGNTAAQKSALSEEAQALFVLGRQHYLTTCAGCHGTDGAGMSRFAPPLAGSEWVLGDARRLALIVLHGMEGPVKVNNKVYDAPDILPAMPAHTTIDDGSIAAILTYIRNEWGNTAGAVNRQMVGTTRINGQGRVVPWTAAELNTYVTQSKSANEK